MSLQFNQAPFNVSTKLKVLFLGVIIYELRDIKVV